VETDVLLEVKGLSKSFPGVQALDNVDFRLDYGSVHAVCGENGAGKSTLMNVLMGIYQRDEGEIYIHGEPVTFFSPKQALDAGIAIIEQELNPVPEMSVAENMFLGRESTKFGLWMDYKTLEERAAEVLAELGVKIDPWTRMKELSLAQVQLVEIAKAISYDSEIIIMDEPTSAIAERDAARLFELIEVLKAKGKGIVYVSHRMKEIFTISDTVTVLRDGKYIGTRPTTEITRSEVVNMMIGRKLEEEYVKSNTPTDETALEVRKLTKTGVFEDISLSVRRGEILGIFGLMGSGRSEFFEALFGADPVDSGEIYVLGERKEHLRPRDAMRNGIALVTEDRKQSGLVLKSSVRDNISLPNLKTLSDGPFINGRRETEAVKRIADQFRVKTPSLSQLVSRLSGGNQQKVVLSKWLLRAPQILLLDEPTRGIDVGAKREIYAFMSEFANKGNAVIMISSELPEVLAMSDRIVVFRGGHKVGERPKGAVTQEELMHLASEGVKEEEGSRV
jgi:ABC-type sugar transport system ATPase subunit